LTVVLGVIFTKLKKPAVFKWHRFTAVLTVLLILLHLLAPNALRFISG
jgi:predicted ferric reductase